MSAVTRAAKSCARCSFEQPRKGWPVDRFIGRVVDGKYRLERRLGAGGFALVFLARQVQGKIDLGQVVLKFLQRNMADNQSVRRRFINEARAARRVSSPHVVKVFDLGFDDEGLPFMVLEYIKGQSLEQLMKRKKQLRPPRVLRICLQIAGALEECHQAEIVHRDLKPDNLMLLSDHDQDFVKVLDFGIARVPSDDGVVTRTIMGTPRYMPPEQILQQQMDAGVDIFALGVILYECLAGSSPIESKTPMEYMLRNISVTPRPLRQACPQLPASLELLLGRMMAKNRADRPASMADVALRLRSIGRQQGWISGAGGLERETGEVDPCAETIPPPSEEREGIWVADVVEAEEKYKIQNMEHGTGDGERSGEEKYKIQNTEHGTGDGERLRGTEDGERGTRNGERGTEDGERGSRSAERGTGGSESDLHADSDVEGGRLARATTPQTSRAVWWAVLVLLAMIVVVGGWLHSRRDTRTSPGPSPVAPKPLEPGHQPQPNPAARVDMTAPDSAAPPDLSPAAPATKKTRPRPRRGHRKRRSRDEWGKEEGGL